jgi:hypothetical protein
MTLLRSLLRAIALVMVSVVTATVTIGALRTCWGPSIAMPALRDLHARCTTRHHRRSKDMAIMTMPPDILRKRGSRSRAIAPMTLTRHW